MKLTLILLLSALTLSSYAQKSPRPLDTATINKAAFIGLVEVKEIDGHHMITKIVRSFKVSKGVQQYILIRVEGDPVNIKEGEVYLFFAKDDTGNKYYVDKYSRILSANESEEDAAILGALLPCLNLNLKNKGCVLRGGYAPVCGCDGQTYRTPCEAVGNGVMMFTDGRCK